MMKLKKDFKVFLLILLILYLAGCARIVTEKIVTGETMTLKVRFRSVIDSVNVKYYLIFSSTVEPLYSTNFGDYFIAPGQTYVEEDVDAYTGRLGINYFYKQYFFTWSDYIFLNQNMFYLYNSEGFFDSTTNETNHYDYIYRSGFFPISQIVGNEILITFSINELSKINKFIYFGCVTVDSSTNKILDVLNYISATQVEAITENSGTDLVDYGVNGSADIVSWGVRIF